MAYYKSGYITKHIPVTIYGEYNTENNFILHFTYNETYNSYHLLNYTGNIDEIIANYKGFDINALEQKLTEMGITWIKQ